MRYQKPKMFEMGEMARRAKGQMPLGCVSGPAAATWETCGVGDAAGWSCVTGPGVTNPHVGCTPGSAADAQGDCLSGSVVQYYCEAGTGGGNDPYGCQAGPSFT